MLRCARSELRTVVAIAIASVLAITGASGCECGGDGSPDGGVDPRDAQAADGSDGSTAIRDGGDGGDGTVGPDRCAAITCPLFELCIDGECVPYPPCAGDLSCPAGEVCRSRYCIPVDVDVDGDGVPAGTDCDESNPERSPEETEVCDAFDNDCDSTVDEGDPASLCEFYPGGGVCMSGSCGCPAGTFDLDRSIPGCECTAAPAITEGQSCPTAIDLGTLVDTGQTVNVMGNVMPDDRVVWYRFVGQDTPDTACDAYHVRALLAANPADTFELTVFAGGCDTIACEDIGYTDFERAFDFRMDVAGTLTGECPCWNAPAAPVDNVSVCTDQTQTFYVRVRRRPGSALSCASYTLELTNGVY